MIVIIIVGYNNKKDLKGCFLSIKKSTYKNYKVIFVDNGSTDDSKELIGEKFKEVIIISNKRNLGFAAGNNIGVKKAIELSAEYIFLLNPDTILDPKCLEELVKNTHRDTILQPEILLYKNNRKTNLINSDGNVLNFLGISYCGNLGRKYQNNGSKEITAASGAAMLVPMRIFKTTGLFDENFFLYHEDADFSWRARMFGYNIKLIPEAKVWHKYEFSKNKNKFFYFERNRLLFLVKNFQLKTLVLILPALLIHEFIGYLYALRNGWFFHRLKAFLSFLILFPDAFKKRYYIQRKRKIPDRLLKQYLIAEIDFPEIKIPSKKMYNNLLKGFWCKIRPFI